MSDDVTLLTSKPVYPGKVVKLQVDRLALPGGQVTELEIIRHPGASAVVPIDAEGRVLMLRQYRHAAGGWIWEIPAGKLDPGEAPEACAHREVAEETGFSVGRLEPLGWIWTTPGFTDEKIWLYAGRELTPTGQNLDEDELLEVVPVELERAIAMAVDGEIADSKTVCALLRLRAGLE